MSNKYEYIILDIETSTEPKLHPWKDGAYVSSVGIKTSAGDSYVWFFNPMIGDYDEHMKQIQWFIDNTNLIVGHHFLFDATWLIHCGIKLRSDIYCTMNNEYILRGQVFKDEHGFLSLNNLAKHYGAALKKDAMKWYWENGYETSDIPVAVHREYLIQDLDTTEEVYLKQRELVKANGLDKVAHLTNLKTKLLAKAMAKGAPFDKNRALEIVQEANKKVDESEEGIKEVLELPDLNLKSSRQMCAAIYGGTIKADGRETYTKTLKNGTIKECSRKVKIDVSFPGVGWTTPFTTEKGGDTVNKNAIAKLKASTPIQKKVLPLLLSRAEFSGRIGTLTGTKGDKGWMSTLGTDGRIHGMFTQTFTHTGRIACQKPNLLNIPRGSTSPLKDIFNPGPGKCIINADLSQIEWRIVTHLSGDETAVKELWDGVDIHTHNAVSILDAKEPLGSPEFKAGPRNLAKIVLFRIVYGGGAGGFAADPKMPGYTRSRWEKIVSGFLEKYSGLTRWWKETVEIAERDGFIRLPSGRIIPATDVDLSSEISQASWLRTLKNYPVQSFSADILLVLIKAFLDARPDYFEEDDVLMFLPVYDSLVFEVSIEKAEQLALQLLDLFKNLTTLVEQYFGIKMLIPLDGEVEIGPNYGATEKVFDQDSIRIKIKELKELKYVDQI